MRYVLPSLSDYNSLDCDEHTSQTQVQQLYEDVRDALGLAPSFSTTLPSLHDFKPLLEEIRRGNQSSSTKQITREMCRHLESEFRKRTVVFSQL